MGTGWRRARSAFGFGVCASVPPELEDETAEDYDAGSRFESRNVAGSRVVVTGNSNGSSRGLQQQTVGSPSPRANCRADSPRSAVQSPRLQCQSSPRLLKTENVSPTELVSNCGPPQSPRSPSLFRSGIRISKSSCAICLETMKPGQGHAIFTAECSHSFHFQCIASNVRHGNLICPVCRAKWKEVPWQAPAKEDNKVVPGTRNENLIPRRQEALRNAEDEQRRLDPVLRILDDSIASFRGHRQSFSQEPPVYDDDEPLDNPRSNEGQAKDQELETAADSEGTSDPTTKMEISLHPEVEAVEAGKACENFTILVHVKAREQISEKNNSRAPIDLVTVLDVSGSMSGTKLSLLKRAMAFVISNLSPADRLSIVAFSSTAKRVFPLKRMVPEGQRSARRVIERLICTGGTNISEGLRKGTKVLEDRRVRNPVASIMLLSDGHDTYSLSSRGGERRSSTSVTSIQSGAVQIPVHTFGFGVDHDAATMHSVSEQSGGTFSFIQSESLVQEAFAQCIGGLLSVVVQDVNLSLSACAATKLKCLHAGSYDTSISDDGSQGTVKLRDLYAEECRDILVDLHLSSILSSSNPTNLVSVNCSYKDPVSQQILQIQEKFLSISRPEDAMGNPVALNLDVQKQQLRLRTAQAIADAKTLADRGEMSGAQEILEKAKADLQISAASARTSDRSLYLSLESEITEIQVRMANRQTYERSGRAFVLSSHSSHLGQRATTRGESFENYSREYQTPSMADMVVRSQNPAQPELISPPNPNPSSSASAWRTAEKLAKVALMRKSCTKVIDLHGFENAGF